MKILHETSWAYKISTKAQFREGGALAEWTLWVPRSMTRLVGAGILVRTWFVEKSAEEAGVVILCEDAGDGFVNLK